MGGIPRGAKASCNWLTMGMSSFKGIMALRVPRKADATSFPSRGGGSRNKSKFQFPHTVPRYKTLRADGSKKISFLYQGFVHRRFERDLYRLRICTARGGRAASHSLVRQPETMDAISATIVRPIVILVDTIITTLAFLIFIPALIFKVVTSGTRYEQWEGVYQFCLTSETVLWRCAGHSAQDAIDTGKDMAGP
eukprot:1550890-Rhodomonas_salina.1